MIYFVQEEFSGFIKIGYTANLDQRVKSLSSTMPGKITLLHYMSGGINEEKALHERFSDLRVKNEWFRPERELSCLEAILSFAESHPDGPPDEVKRVGRRLPIITRIQVMEPGEERAFPDDNPRSIHTAMVRLKREGMAFMSRTTPRGVIVWRLA